MVMLFRTLFMFSFSYGQELIYIFPDCGFHNPYNMFNIVDFPHPLSPTIAVILFFSNSMLIFFKTSFSEYLKLTFSKDILSILSILSFFLSSSIVSIQSNSPYIRFNATSICFISIFEFAIKTHGAISIFTY